MKRERATAVLGEMLDRLEQGRWPANLVREVYLFGSYIRGALEVGDVDVIVQHTTDKRWLQESLQASIAGRDGYISFKQALRGSRRGVSFHFQELSTLREAGFDMLPLWRHGEPLDLARIRLREIPTDPAAGRAPRDHVLAAYEQIADLLPRPVRIDLHRWCTEATAAVTVLDLPDGRPSNPLADRRLQRRWSATSPLLRAAGAALAHLESEGQPLRRVALHGRHLDHEAVDADIDCFVDLHWRYWHSVERYLDDGQSWLEVLPATSRQPLHAVRITPIAKA